MTNSSAWTDQKLRALSKDQLLQLYENACNKGDDAAIKIIDAIEQIGVPPRKSKLPIDSPIRRAIEVLVHTDEALKAGIAAAHSGLPPLAAVDPLLQKALGEDYNSNNGSTLEAGFLLAQAMRTRYWEPIKGRTRRLPTGCVAKTATMFAHIPSERDA